MAFRVPGVGLERWLVDPGGGRVRRLDDGESVRRPGYHVAFLPREDATFEVRRRIKRELLTTTACALARKLTEEGVPSPDSGRTRRDRGIEHPTSGAWHATTVTNIGRDGIDSGVTGYGRRSTGDRLRFGRTGRAGWRTTTSAGTRSPRSSSTTRGRS